MAASPPAATVVAAILRCGFCAAKIAGLQTQQKGCDIVGLLQESKRPLPRKLRKKSEKGFPGPLGPGVVKTRKRVENDNFSSFFSSFRLVFNSFSTFLSFFDPRAERPGNPFSDILRSFLGRGPFDSCRRPMMSQQKGVRPRNLRSIF